MSRNLINRFIDIKAALTSLIVVFTVLVAVFSQVERIATSIADGIYAKVTEPAYTIVKYDLLKQLEKLQNDPDDIKRQDVVKFTHFCDGYFGLTYIPSQPSLVARDLSIGCEKITELYSRQE